MMDVIIGFLVDGHDVIVVSVCGLDMGSSRFVVHDCSRWTTRCKDEEDEKARPVSNTTTHIRQWGTTLQVLGLGILPWR
jgi:hypothetical protein